MHNMRVSPACYTLLIHSSQFVICDWRYCLTQKFLKRSINAHVYKWYEVEVVRQETLGLQYCILYEIGYCIIIRNKAKILTLALRHKILVLPWFPINMIITWLIINNLEKSPILGHDSVSVPWTLKVNDFTKYVSRAHQVVLVSFLWHLRVYTQLSPFLGLDDRVWYFLNVNVSWVW